MFLALSRIAMGIVLLLPSFALFALSSDTQQAIYITANSSLFDYKTGTNSYKGNVIVKQGTTELHADRVVTRYNAHHKIEEVIAYGESQLAEYITTPKPGDAVFHAKAKLIKFYPPLSTANLEGDVIVTQGENSFHGPRIVYDMKNQTVTAPASKQGRATIIIESEKVKS